MNNLHKWAAISALVEASLYIGAFIFFGAIWDFPSHGSIITKLSYLSDNHTSLFMVHVLLYLLFGVLLAIIVQSIQEHLTPKAERLAKLAAVFGYIWVALVITSGMLANIGLDVVIGMAATKPEQAWMIWLVIDTVVEGIGGGNEIVGGLWVLILSIAAIKTGEFSRALNLLGIFVGGAGVMTIYPAEVFTEIFGLSQIIWFIALAIELLKSHKLSTQLTPNPPLVSNG